MIHTCGIWQNIFVCIARLADKGRIELLTVHGKTARKFWEARKKKKKNNKTSKYITVCKCFHNIFCLNQLHIHPETEIPPPGWMGPVTAPAVRTRDPCRAPPAPAPAQWWELRISSGSQCRQEASTLTALTGIKGILDQWTVKVHFVWRCIPFSSPS